MSHFGGPLSSIGHLTRTPGPRTLPRWRQLVEVALLYGLRGIGPGYYVQARWGRRSIPFRDKWDHVNRREYRRFVDAINPPAYRKASQHKLVEKAVLGLFDIPTPAFIAHVQRDRARGADGRPLTCAGDLEALLASREGRRICVKPVEGHGGSGFLAYEVGREGGRLALVAPHGGERTDVARWWNAHAAGDEGVVIEDYLQQHPSLAALNASSVNTLRIWVWLDAGRYRVPGAYLRVGRAGSMVDNVAGGGLVCPIDVSRGQVREALDISAGCRVIDRHPDSGVPFAGLQIPYWEQSVELAGRALSAFPRLGFAGVDVAITAAGPAMIELNVVPDYIGCARMDLPLRRLIRERAEPAGARPAR